MYRKIEVNAEHNEIILENSHGDKVIIPANKRNWVKQKLSEGCHGCIDSLVETLPVVNNYAQDGTVFPNEKQPIVLITPSGRKVETDTDSDFYRTHYNSKLIGKQNEDKSWNLTDEIYQGESLPEVVVTSKIQPNTFRDYKNQFNKNYPKDKFLKEFEINTRAVSDNTTSIIPTLQGNKILATPLETPLTPEQLNEKVQRKKAADAQEIQRRKDNISRSNSSKPFSRESFLNTAIGDKMRFFPNDPNSIIDEYINPLKWIGDMADNLGHTFADPNSSITDKAIALGTPLLVGAIGSNLGSPKISNNQFLNNVFNPLPIPMNSTKILNKIDNNSFYRQIGKEGYEDAIKTGVIRSNPVGEYAGKAPYFVEGKDFDNLYSTGAGAGGKKPEYIFEMPQLKNPEEMSAFRVNQQEGYAPYVAGSKEIPISQGKIYRLNNKNEYELIDATKAGSKMLNKIDDIIPKKQWYDNFHLGELSNELPINYKGDFIERGVAKESALNDFFNTGIIRNNKSAGLPLNKRSSNYGERVFFGPSSESSILPRNNYTFKVRYSDELKNRPVTFNDVEDIIIKNADGTYSSMPNWKDKFKNHPNYKTGADDVNKSVKPAWQMQELPGLHLKSTMEGEAVSKIVEPKTGLINTEQALAIIAKESGGSDKVALIRKGIGNNIPKKMNYNEFRKVVQDQLIPLERQFSEQASNYGVGRLGYPSPKRSSYEKAIKHNEEMIEHYKKQIAAGSDNSSLKGDLQNAINNLEKSKKELATLPLENQTLILGNKGKFGRGSSAHGNPEETLGHVHFLRDAETPDVLTVTQIQSDAFQGTHRIMPKTQQEALEKVNKLKKEGVEIKSMFGDGKESSNAVLANYEKHLQLDEASAKNFTQKQLLDKNHQERYLQELVDYAGKRGDVNKVRVPTSETAAKVQGYNKVPTNRPQGFEGYWDVNTSGNYSSEHQTILKKYSQQPKTIKKLFGIEPKVVTDSKGNTWYEFDIPKKFKKGKGEIKAFGLIPPAIGIGTVIQSQQNKSEQ